MIVELVNTGSELMLGRVLNSHQQWLCRQFADRGYRVARQLAVADDAPEIEQAVREALSRADLVVTTGGLGPTSDDLTRDVIARLLGTPLREDAETLARIQAFFALRNRPMPERTRLEAQVPLGALVLPNLHGTAPGLAIEVSPNPFRDQGQGSWLILLPGPARELRPMFTDFVVPFLQRARSPCRNRLSVALCGRWAWGNRSCRNASGEALRGLVSAGLEVGYCARPGQVDVRLAATGERAGEKGGGGGSRRPETTRPGDFRNRRRGVGGGADSFAG